MDNSELSDTTCGWDGSDDSFNMYFLYYPLEYSDHSPARTITLSHNSGQKIMVRMQETSFLGNILY